MEADQLNPAAASLVAEFQKNLGLDEVDAQRSAFIVFAYRRGWSKAQIGRFQGISRARVEQKISKYKLYACHPNWPVLETLLNGNEPEPVRNKSPQIQFTVKHWSDPAFAKSMLNRVA